MSPKNDQILYRAILRILRPLVRLLLRNGIPFGEFAECAKRAYVQSAVEDFGIEGRKTTDSRVAIMSGLTRKEVKRLRELEDPSEIVSEAAKQNCNRAARVISGWVRDNEFHDESGATATLPLESEDGCSFSALVKLYSGDVPVRAVLDELIRVGAVVQYRDGRVDLVKRAYLPEGDNAQQVHILGEDVSALLETIDRNIANDNRQPLFQRTLTYDNVPEEALPMWRETASKQSQRFLEKLDHLLTPLDRDLSSGGPKGTGRMRTGVGIFFFEEPHGDSDTRTAK